MSANILNIVYGKIDSDLLKNISTLLNEESVKTQLAFKAAVAALLGGMIKKSVSMDGAEQIFRTVDSLKPALFDNYEELVKNDHQALVKAGNAIASKVFGSHRGVFVDSIAKYAGIELNSSKTLVSLVGPLIVGAVQEQKTEQSLKRTGIVNLLAEQKDSLAGQLPTSLSNKFGFTEFAPRSAQRATPATALPQKSFSTSSSAKLDSEAAEELRKKFAFGSTKSVASIPSSTRPPTSTPAPAPPQTSTSTPTPSTTPAAEQTSDAGDSSALDLDSSATIQLSDLHIGENKSPADTNSTEPKQAAPTTEPTAAGESTETATPASVESMTATSATSDAHVLSQTATERADAVPTTVPTADVNAALPAVEAEARQDDIDSTVVNVKPSELDEELSQAVTTARADVFTSPAEATNAKSSPLKWFKVVAPIAFVFGLGAGAWYLNGNSDQSAGSAIGTSMPLVRTNSESDHRDSGEATGNHAARIGESIEAIASAEPAATESSAADSTTAPAPNATTANTNAVTTNAVVVPQPQGGEKTDGQDKNLELQPPSEVAAQGQYALSQEESSAVQSEEQVAASLSSAQSSDPGSLAEARYQAVIRELEADLHDAMLIAEESNAVAYPIDASNNNLANTDRATTDVARNAYETQQLGVSKNGGPTLRPQQNNWPSYGDMLGIQEPASVARPSESAQLSQVSQTVVTSVQVTSTPHQFAQPQATMLNQTQFPTSQEFQVQGEWLPNQIHSSSRQPVPAAANRTFVPTSRMPATARSRGVRTVPRRAAGR